MCVRCCSVFVTVFCFLATLVVSSGIPAYFILGDSLADPGNNNYFSTLAKSNFPPYGKQFDTGLPTGRFTNGRTTLDYLGSSLGLPLIPAYLDPSTRGAKLLQGVNFASAGSGILDSTGNIFGKVIPLSVQVEQLRKVKQEITQLVGTAATQQLMEKSLFSVLIGSNDYINNYLLKATREAKLLSASQFQDLLTTTYASLAQGLLDLGVRKLHLINVPPIGCIPRSLDLYESRDGECIQFVNKLASDYNAGLASTASRLRASNPQAKIVLSNAYSLVYDLVKNPAAYGFTTASKACCGVGRFNGALACLPDQPICKDVQNREFFDSFHTSDKANKIIASGLLNGGTDVNFPMNVAQLAA